jgi:hypothetical protein
MRQLTGAQVDAIKVTRDIVTSKMSSSTITANKGGGKAAGEFFEEIYNKVYAILINGD